MREDQKHYHPPNKEYLPPAGSGYDVPTKEYLPPHHHHEDPLQHYSPPATDYLRPQLSVPNSLHHHPGADYLPPPSRLDLKLAESTEYPPGAEVPSRPKQEYVPGLPSPTVGPIPGYLPPPPEKFQSDLVPSLKEVLAALGPPLSGPALLLPEGGPGPKPDILSPPPPPKLPPQPEKLVKAGYLPPPSKGYPEISGPLSDYLPPKGGPKLVLPDKYGADAYIPPPEKIVDVGGYIPPPEKVAEAGYIPPPGKAKGGYLPPPELSGVLSDYLPPPGGPALVLPLAKKKAARRPHTSERYIAPPEVQILDIKTKPDYIPPPARPQTPVPEPPPPEAIPSELPPLERLNSQGHKSKA